MCYHMFCSQILTQNHQSLQTLYIKQKKQKSPYLNIHIGATALHYGQSCFEGLKAFAHDDGSVYLFRPDENAKR